MCKSLYRIRVGSSKKTQLENSGAVKAEDGTGTVHTHIAKSVNAS